MLTLASYETAHVFPVTVDVQVPYVTQSVMEPETSAALVGHWASGFPGTTEQVVYVAPF